MTAFTLSGGGTTLWDSLTAGSVNATLDVYTISNNTTLKIDTDTYQCANHSIAFGSLDSVSFSGIGGRLLFDGTTVRVIPFNTGSGTVPAIGTAITQGGVSGPLLGVWANWQSEPLAAGAAMPATGFIKIRSKTGGSFAAGALTGITATATGPDVVGWIEIRGADTAQITVPRIGKFEVIGDWFVLGTTTGVRGQILECPTSATVAGTWPGIWVETGVGTNVYERWAGVGSMVNLATNPTDERGKMFWHVAAGLRIGSDGVNNVGFLPPAGCRVRIPNVIATCCTRTVSGSGPRVLPNATLNTRQKFFTTAAGDIAISNFVCPWYANFLQAFRTVIRNSAFNDTILIQEVSSPIDIANNIVSPTQAQVNTTLNMLSCFAGGTVNDNLFVRFSVATGTYVGLVSFSNGVNFTNNRNLVLTNRATSSGGAWIVTQSSKCNFDQNKLIGGRAAFVTCTDCTMTNTSYADNIAGTTQSGSATSVLDIASGCTGTLFSGLDFFGLTEVQPRSAIVNITASYKTKVRNIGTFAAPLNCGTTNPVVTGVAGLGNCDDVLMQRLFMTGITNPFLFTNSDNNIKAEQVGSVYANATPVVSLNSSVKGSLLTGVVTGQTAVYGAHWKDTFTSATTGKIEITCNEPTTASAAQCQITAGVPKFNSSGAVAMTVIGDQVTWEMNYFAKGHTALANLAPTNTVTNPANHNFEFQYDKGAGYNGTWLALNAANLTGAGAITPAVGVKLKVRVTCTVAAATNLLTNIAIPTVTTAVDQGANLYPLDVNTITFTGLPTGCDTVVLTAGTSTVLDQRDQLVTTSYSFTYSGAQNVDVGFLKNGYVPFYIRNLALTTNDNTIPVALTVDRNFA